MNYIQRVGETSDGRHADVEALRRELADLVLEWAGKAVSADPASPLGAALIQAVREAARDAVAEQQTALTEHDAEALSEAVARRWTASAKDGGASIWPAKTLVVAGVVAVVLATLTFVVGWQAGRLAAPDAALAADAVAVGSSAVVPLAPPTETAPALAPAVGAPIERHRPEVVTPFPTPSPRAAPAARRASPFSGRPATAVAEESGGQPVMGARPTSAPSASADPTAPGTAP